jgi:uncharacterized protein (DUF697 family)
MANQDREDWIDSLAEAIAKARITAEEVAIQFQGTSLAVETAITEQVMPAVHRLAEQGTVVVGRVVSPLVDNPFVQYATKIPGINWIMAVLGQVNGAAVEKDVAELRQQFPLETEEQLAHRVILNTAWKAAGVGLLTNAIPPVALMMFAIDLGAIAALQAQMIYRIAAIYGFSPTDPTRRGEVIALWGLSTGSSGMLKTGLSFVELLPGLGALVGVGSDTGLLYGMGQLARRFYEEKRKSGSDSTNS